MSLQATELFATNSRIGQPRAVIKSIRPKSFASGSGTLAKLTPVAKNTSTGFYSAWSNPVSEVDTITEVPTVTSGTWTITVDGQVSAAIAWNASNATILAALLAMPNINPTDIVLSGGGVTGVKTAPLVLTWGGKFTGKAFTVTVSSASLVGGTYGLAQTTAGVESESVGLNKIVAFVWPDPIVLSGSGEVIGNVALEGIIFRDDVPLVSPVTQPQLDAALKDIELRRLGFEIQGLAGV